MQKKPDVMGTNGYNFWIQHKKLVLEHLYFQEKYKSPKNL